MAFVRKITKPMSDQEWLWSTIRLHKGSVLTAGGCRYWLGSKNQDGYGMMSFQGTTRLVHNVAYELYIGPVPEGKELDHICRNRWCINHHHLEPVTHKENGLRGSFHQKQFCVRGHPRNSQNLQTTASGKTDCRLCRHERYINKRYGKQPKPL